MHGVVVFESSVSAAVEDHSDFPGPKSTVALEAAFDRDQRRVTRVGGGQFFTVAHDHLDRAAGGFGERVAERNVHQRSFAAEVAAHWTDLEADFFFRQIEALGEMRSSDVGTLSRTPDENAPGRFDIDDHGVGLEIAV